MICKTCKRKMEKFIDKVLAVAYFCKTCNKVEWVAKH